MNFKTINKATNKVIVVIFSIVIVMLLFWLILFGFSGQDGNLLIKNIFYDWTTSIKQTSKILKTLASFLLGSLAVLLCYRGGIINISVAGQMSLTGLVIFFTGYGLKKVNPNVNWFPILILVGIIAAVALSLLIAVLKIYFNINEVLSGIFLNFIIYFFYKFLVKQKNILDPVGKLSTNDSLGIMLQYNFTIFQIIPISLILAFMIFGFICFLLMKTRYGLKLKLINKYKKSARYTGIKYERNIFKLFIISGIISGIAGLFYYFKSIDSSKLYLIDALPNNGFDTITIVWLSQYSIIGLPFISFFMALLREQQTVLPISHLNPEIFQIMIGTILLLVPFLSQLLFNEKQKEKLKEGFCRFKILFKKERNKY